METRKLISIENASVVYHIDKAQIQSSQVYGIGVNTILNNSHSDRKYEVDFNIPTPETSSWSDSPGTQTGVKVTGSLGIPFVAEDKIEVSPDVTKTFTLGKTYHATKEIDISISIKVLAGKSLKVILEATKSFILVPPSANYCTTL